MRVLTAVPRIGMDDLCCKKRDKNFEKEMDEQLTSAAGTAGRAVR